MNDEILENLQKTLKIKKEFHKIISKYDLNNLELFELFFTGAISALIVGKMSKKDATKLIQVYLDACPDDDWNDMSGSPKS